MNTRRVLVVDDSNTCCRMVEIVLRKCGFEQIESAQNAHAAFARLREQPFDIVISDWEMEPVSGIELLHQVRRHPDTRGVAFILMSAKKEPHWVLEATRAGVDCLIAKPFDAETLKQKIAQVDNARERTKIREGVS
jgi:two-component system chemotaxis response regulator CheY